MKSLKRMIEDPRSRHGRLFSLTIQSLILLSLVTFSIDTLPDLSDRTRTALHWIETVTVLIFTVEYITRLVVADRKLKFVFSFFGLVDLAAIVPFYLATGLDLRSIRAFRFLRLIRILKLVRYNAALMRFGRALEIAREELLLFGFVALLLLYLSAVGIYFFEHTAQPEQFSSVFDGLWWAVVTLTTVGYGDAYPITLGGRMFTFFVLIIGLGVIAVPTGLVASALTEARSEKGDREGRNAGQGEDLDEPPTEPRSP